jgi:hypothetical protein
MYLNNNSCFHFHFLVFFNFMLYFVPVLFKKMKGKKDHKACMYMQLFERMPNLECGSISTFVYSVSTHH